MSVQLVGLTTGQLIQSGDRFRITWGVTGLFDSIGQGVDVAKKADQLYQGGVTAQGNLVYPIARPLVDANAKSIVLDVRAAGPGFNRPVSDLIQAMKNAAYVALSIPGLAELELLKLEKIGVAASSAAAAADRGAASAAGATLAHQESTAVQVGTAAAAAGKAALSGLGRLALILGLGIVGLLLLSSKARGALDWE